LKSLWENESFLNPSKGVLQIVDSEDFSHTAAELIVRDIIENLELKDFFTLVLPGGSTPGKMYEVLASDETFRSKIPWERIHFFWGDERHVPPDHKESNYRMAHGTMLSKIPVPAENIHRIKSENPDADEAAKQYEEELQTFFNIGTGELPRFDCVLLGMGTDGHTASLFPGTDALYERKRLVVATWVERFQMYRITLTLPLLNNTDFVMFLVSGKEKAEVLKEVIEGKGHTNFLPAQLIRPEHGRLLWLVDKSAARHLNYSHNR